MRRSALTIAGLDPSGGAGIAADLRGFAAAGAWGMAVCAAITVQSTHGVRGVHPVLPALLTAQAREVLADSDVRAIKTGALGSAENARAVVALLRAHESIPSVVDPVMASSRSRGLRAARLDGPDGERALRALAAIATLVTPNLAEATALLGSPVVEAEARDAAVALVEAGARAALVKGGHGRAREAVDWLAIGGRVVRIARPRRHAGAIHGTGCSLAALIAGRLAVLATTRREPTDDDLVRAVRWARSRLDAALSSPHVIGHGMRVIDVGSRVRKPQPPSQKPAIALKRGTIPQGTLA